jgi:DNA-binding transcriptional regulator YiaG
MPSRKRKDSPSIGELMVQGAREAVAHKRGGLPHARLTTAKITVRSAEVIPPPKFQEQDVRRVRERLGLSQTLFADLLGASTSTVRAWERGAREPSEMARRLLELADRQPQAFEEALLESDREQG